MFEAVKHGLWDGESLGFAAQNLSFHKMKNEEWRVKKQFLQILTSLSSLFPDKFLSRLLTSEQGESFYPASMILHLFESPDSSFIFAQPFCDKEKS